MPLLSCVCPIRTQNKYHRHPDRKTWRVCCSANRDEKGEIKRTGEDKEEKMMLDGDAIWHTCWEMRINNTGRSVKLERMYCSPTATTTRWFSTSQENEEEQQQKWHNSVQDRSAYAVSVQEDHHVGGAKKRECDQQGETGETQAESMHLLST